MTKNSIITVHNKHTFRKSEEGRDGWKISKLEKYSNLLGSIGISREEGSLKKRDYTP